MAFSSKQLFSDHRDLIHHVAYDFHGKRIATCSSDQSVTVWDLNHIGVWERSNSWKTHSGPVWKVVWAHPEFGQILATCSFDRSAHIWEEVVSDTDRQIRGQRSLKDGPNTHWKKRTALVDSRSNVTDIKFSPKHLGLLLGIVRIYEAIDMMDLNRWQLLHEIEGVRSRCSCISWSFGRFQPTLLAAGCDDPNSRTSSRVNIFEFDENKRQWSRTESLLSVLYPVSDLDFSPSAGRSFHLLAVASNILQIFAFKPLLNSGNNDSEMSRNASKFDVQELASFDHHGGQVK